MIPIARASRRHVSEAPLAHSAHETLRFGHDIVRLSIRLRAVAAEYVPQMRLSFVTAAHQCLSESQTNHSRMRDDVSKSARFCKR